ncbi:MAG: MBL fold metallo-hydrolase [Halobacteriales archaeon]|nr:MBL fold metallo-hydrolase [Halobacteriales archaeon]
MAIGDVRPVDLAGVEGLHYVDTGMFDTEAQTSVYVVDAERPAVIDAGIGTDHELLLDALAEIGIELDALEWILPTHVHLDHAGGAGHLAEACPNATVAVPAVGAPHLVDPGRLVEGTKRTVGDAWQHYAEPVPIPEGRVRPLSGGDVVDLGDRVLDVHDAPGHAPHQAVFHDPDAAVAFTADAAGMYVPRLDRVEPTTPPPNFDLEQCLDDVATLRALDPDVLCYPHFGPARTADRLDEYARVLEDWVERVADAREALGDDDAVVDRLAVPDDLADLWGEGRAAWNVELNARGVLHSLDRRAG